jgi:hypothetical protein
VKNLASIQDPEAFVSALRSGPFGPIEGLVRRADADGTFVWTATLFRTNAKVTFTAAQLASTDLTTCTRGSTAVFLDSHATPAGSAPR